MSVRRRWATKPARGRMVNHPAVVAAAEAWDSARVPKLAVLSGLPIVSYCRTRVFFDRDAWEMLPANGVLLLRVESRDGRRRALALTAQELEAVFGEVRMTRSWEQHRCYHFPTEPLAASSFDVGLRAGRPVATVETGDRAPVASPRRRSRPERRAAAGNERAGGGDRSFEGWAAGWYDRLGAHAESAEYLNAVVAWRQVWRPERTRIVLLAESHVGEHPGDSEVSVRPVREAGRELPEQYVRLIYCLAYGESDICTVPPESNRGTSQFWNIFGRVALDQSPPRKGDVPIEQRLCWKIQVLEELERRGIWLQDASPLGIYLGRSQRVDPRYYVQLLREGYERYVWPTFANDAPEQVWIIGKGVATALAGDCPSFCVCSW